MKLLLWTERVLVQVAISFIVGILGGNIWDKPYIPIFLTLITMLTAYSITNHIRFFLYSCFIILGILAINYHPILHHETNTTLEVTILEVVHNTYNTNLTVYDLPYKYIIQVTNSEYEFTPYDKIIVEVEPVTDTIKYNPADMDYALYLKSEGISSTLKATNIVSFTQVDNWFETLNNKISNLIYNVFKAKDQGIVSVLMLGDKSTLDADVYASYSQLSITHILVISGFHLGIIFLIVKNILIQIGFSHYERFAGATIIMWLYVLIIGFSVSIVRAALLFTIMSIAFCVDEESDMLTSIAIASLIMLIQNPFALFGISFQLSFFAVIIIACYDLAKDYLDTDVPNEGLILSAIISACNVPIVSYYFFSISVVGILANVLLLPVFSTLIVLIGAVLAIAIFNINIAIVLAYPITAIINLCNELVMLISNVGAIYIGRMSFLQIVLYYTIVGLVIISIINVQYQKVCGMINIGLCIVFYSTFRPQFEITQLYVGQGDSTVIRTHNNSIIVVDGGLSSGASKIQNHIRYLGKNTIDLVVVSHTDTDHVGGILELLNRGQSIGMIVVPPINIENDAIGAQLISLCNQNNIPIIEATTGEIIAIDDVVLSVLAPAGTSSDKNENSLVVELNYKDFSMLFTGDIGVNTENTINFDDIDVLKVAHHGSKTSTSTNFLNQTKPEYAVISCGFKNIYGHPHEIVLETLDTHNIETFRTDLNGAIKIQLTGDDIFITSYIK